MLCARMDSHRAITEHVELLEDLSRRLFLQLGRHRRIPPQATDVSQALPSRRKSLAVGVAGPRWLAAPARVGSEPLLPWRDRFAWP